MIRAVADDVNFASPSVFAFTGAEVDHLKMEAFQPMDRDDNGAPTQKPEEVCGAHKTGSVPIDCPMVPAGPRETLCVKDVKDLAFLALARCRSELELPLNTI